MAYVSPISSSADAMMTSESFAISMMRSPPVEPDAASSVDALMSSRKSVATSRSWRTRAV